MLFILCSPEYLPCVSLYASIPCVVYYSLHAFYFLTPAPIKGEPMHLIRGSFTLLIFVDAKGGEELVLEDYMVVITRKGEIVGENP